MASQIGMIVLGRGGRYPGVARAAIFVPNWAKSIVDYSGADFYAS